MSAIKVPNFVRNGMLGVEGQEVINTSNDELVFTIPPRIGILGIQAVNTGSANYQVYTTLDPVVDASDLNLADWFPVFGANQTGPNQSSLYGAISYIRFKFNSGAGSVKCSIRGQ